MADVYNVWDGVDVFTGIPTHQPPRANRFGGPWPMPEPYQPTKAELADQAVREEEAKARWDDEATRAAAARAAHRRNLLNKRD
jgi:hypothetical protein